MDPAQFEAAARHADAALASQTTDTQLQAAIAASREDLWPALAANPASYPDLLTWLGDMGVPEVDAALAARAGRPAGTPAAPTASAGAAPTSAPSAWSAAVAPAVIPAAASAPAPGAWSAAPAPAPAPAPVPAAASPAPSAGPGRSHRGLIAGALAVVLVLVAAGGWLIGRAQSGDAAGGTSAAGDSAAAGASPASQGQAAQDAPATITACATDPTVEVTSVTADNSTMTAELHVTPSCSEGDVLTGSRNHLLLTSPQDWDSPGSTVAIGELNLSTSPAVMSGGGADVTVTFPAGQYYRIVNVTPGEEIAATLTADRSDSSASGDSADATSSVTVTASESSGGADEEEAAAEVALGRLADDTARHAQYAEGHWYAQLSSKKVGLQVEGRTWDNRTILQQYFDYTTNYGSIILTRAHDWSVFDADGDWYVLLADVGATSDTDANAWCDSRSIGKDDCFAKMLSTTRSAEGTTTYR